MNDPQRRRFDKLNARRNARARFIFWLLMFALYAFVMLSPDWQQPDPHGIERGAELSRTHERFE